MNDTTTATTATTTTTATTRDIRSAAFWDALTDEMNAHPERFTVLGDCDMVAALVMRSDAGDTAVQIVFDGLRCEDTSIVDIAAARAADYFLDGPVTAWQTMFDDIVAHGAATGRLTINSLTLLGDDIRLRGDDPMGVDKFSRFNQTLQEYLDGAARIATPA